MKELLADIKARLLNGEYKNEEHIRLSLVARVLQGLGWNVWNPIEVNSEFVVVPDEDNKKVDVALFLRPFVVPTVFVEIKAVGQMQSKLTATELQMRNYNRDNQAMFTVITDGRNWRFYLSSAAGEFSRRCFKTFDLLADDLEEVEASLSVFLRKSEIEKARQKAEDYLKLNQIQRTAEDCLPEARRKISEPPYPSLPAALVSLVGEKGYSINHDDAVKFIKEADERKPSAPVAYQTDQTSAPYSESGREPSYVSMAGRNAFIRKLRDESNDWASAWGKILAKYPGSSIGRCKNVWEKKERIQQADNQTSSKKKTGKFTLIVSLAKAGKTESQIAAAVKNEYGPLSGHTAYLVGREWRRVNKLGRHFAAAKAAANTKKLM
jgi:hypothetical protein